MTCRSFAVPVLAVALACHGAAAGAQEPEKEEEKQGDGTSVTYGPSGLVIQSGDGNYRAQIRFRIQFRVTHPFDEDPVAGEDFALADATSLAIRRARFKIGGHAIRPWIDYFVEYDFPSSRLLDFRVTLTRLPWLHFRIGQWKVEFNRERRDSSGEQQFVDRSIVNAPFTVDRQQGLELTGRVLKGTVLDSTYFAGVFTGTGANERANDDSRPMWMARYQWNPFGRELPFSQSDVQGRAQPAASLAVAGVWNRSPFTRFSSAGGGALPGFELGGPGRYSVHQWMEEAALHWRGFSFQHEFHWKTVDDNETGVETRLRGTYVQAGAFVFRPEPEQPKGLEVAARYAVVDPSSTVDDDRQEEVTAAANWFFRGHSNKVSVDVSRLALEQAGLPDRVFHRARAQWDVQF